MSQYSDELGAWWTGFPGSDRATWLASAPGALAPARTGSGGHFPARAEARPVIRPASASVPAGEIGGLAAPDRSRHPRPALKSGVITLGSGFGGTGKTDVAVTLAAIYAAARPADRVILADSNDDMPHGYIRLGGLPVESLPPDQRTLSIRGFYQACAKAASRSTPTCAMRSPGCRAWL